MVLKAITLSACIGFILAVSGNHAAQAQDDSKVDLAKLTCKAYLKLDNDEEEYTTVFFHGLLSGKKNEMMADLEKLSKATDAVVDYCITNPGETLMSAFEKARK